jgi:hypothetical protein
VRQQHSSRSLIERQLISGALSPRTRFSHDAPSEANTQKLRKENMKTVKPGKSFAHGVSLERWIWKSVLIAVVATQLGLSIPVFAAEDNGSGMLKFNRAEYMKATATGQKKAQPSVKGDLCFDPSTKKIEFRNGKGDPAFSIKYDAIKSLLYEQAAKPRYTEAVLISPLFLLAHSKKHFLTIQYTDTAGASQFVIVHLDKKNAQEAIAAAESQTGKSVDRVEEK